MGAGVLPAIRGHMPKGFADTSVEEARRMVSIRQILAYMGIKIEWNNMALCPFHDDKNPSMIVNDESVFCFACGRGWDIYEFLGAWYDLTPDQSYAWIKEHIEELPKVEGFKARKRGVYRGPVDLKLIDYWHSCLEDREPLYTERLLTDETINNYKLGWRKDHHCWVIPFWSGEPGKSEVEIVQFRRTDKSPFDTKFIGLSGHNKPSFMGKHSLVHEWGILLFGTYDALLCVQDGFPCVSPNGSSVFTRKTSQKELLDQIGHVKRWTVIPDNTPSEQKSMHKMLNLLEAPYRIVELPQEFKDYGEYRKQHSRSDFYHLLTHISG